jgi:hypothetical protein
MPPVVEIDNVRSFCGPQMVRFRSPTVERGEQFFLSIGETDGRKGCT